MPAAARGDAAASAGGIDLRLGGLSFGAARLRRRCFRARRANRRPVLRLLLRLAGDRMSACALVRLRCKAPAAGVGPNHTNPSTRDRARFDCYLGASVSRGRAREAQCDTEAAGRARPLVDVRHQTHDTNSG